MSEIRIENISFDSACQNQKIAAYVVTCPSVEPHAILQITHGMAEYWMRYIDFAEYMARLGYVVCGHDDLGHGDTSGVLETDGFFADKDGAGCVLRDIHHMTELIKQRYPGLPLILFGHSMGSFFARWAAETWPEAQTAAIFCGTGGENPAAPAGLALTKFLTILRGPRFKSKMVDKMAFGAYLKRIENPKTPFDWLSTNEENVARYIKDPKCGFLFTVSAFHDMMGVVRHVNTDEWANGIRKDMPVLITAGSNDPVGEYGEGPREVAQRLTVAGVKKVSIQLYDGMRHEILNETGKQGVWDDLFAWCEQATRMSAAVI